MRLIDADLLKKEIHMSYSDDLGILEIIDVQPTVFDDEQFRAEIANLLEKEKCTPLDDSVVEDISCRVWNKAIQTAIGIVRTAGKEKKIEDKRDEAASFLRKDDAVMETVLSKDLWACFRTHPED